MGLKIFVIKGFIFFIVGPVHQIHACRYIVQGFPGEAFGAAPLVEEHIAPNHNLHTVLIGQFLHPVQMFQQNIELVAVAVLSQIPPHSQAKCLIHTNVDFAGGKALGYRREHIINQCIDSLIAHKKHICHIHMGSVFLPAGEVSQMGQHLNTGNQFDANRPAIRIHILQFHHGVAATHIAEIWFVFHLVGILGVEHQTGIAHIFYNFSKFLYLFRLHHTITGTINHNSQFFYVHRIHLLGAHIMLWPISYRFL